MRATATRDCTDPFWATVLWAALSLWCLALLAPTDPRDHTAGAETPAQHAGCGTPDTPQMHGWPERTEELVHELHDSQEEDEDLQADPSLDVRLHLQARSVGRIAAAEASLGQRRLRPPGD